jgi:ATP-binding cassette, subfamily B, bacterial
MQNARISMDRLNEIHTHEEEEQAHKNLQQELPQGFLRQLAGGRTHTEFNGAPVSEYAAGPSIGRVNGYAGVDDLPCIQFKNVVFTYPGAGNEPVLKDINMKIPRGKTTAIVGVSGSGKTTLLKLLLKFYEPQKGEIRVDNTMLNNISHRVWRQHCGVVMQDSFIFSDTIAHNIAVGEEKIDMDRLVYAVEVANVRGFIEDLPLGFNTKIGADGTGISMGQRQRLLIARAVYRDPQFIFFDEATNSLDASNESVIIQNLESFFKGRTVVIVAHRLSTVKHADQIALLNRGSITERGTHQQLTALKGDYYSLVKNQLDLGN